MSEEFDRVAVTNLQEYLRIRSVHPNVNYDECISFLKRKAEELDLPVQVFEVVPKKPILVMTWAGLQPELPSILLNSHMDVVPVFEESWTHPPFAAEIVDGVIYGRGSQDMKSVAIIYLETIRRLKSQGVRLKRTVHLTFVPDEEIGGVDGMAKFVHTEHFRNLNVAFGLDEGLPSPNDEYVAYNGERSIWHITITCPGTSGHGSLLLPNTCGEKIRYIIDKFMDMRQESKSALESNPQFTIGDVTSVNLTKLSGGIQDNVVPEKMTATFDIRVALSVDHTELENTIKQWCREAGEGVTYEFTQKNPYVPPTKVDDSNPYWLAVKAALDSLDVPLSVRTFPGGTDSRFVRAAGVAALCLSPLRRARVALHAHDEGLPAAALLEGIAHYTRILTRVANV